MIFGIDFGTTNTVVSWATSANNIEFLTWQDGKTIKPTIINDMENIKRMVVQNSGSLNFNDSVVYKNIQEFFVQIKQRIQDVYTHIDSFECVLSVPARFDDVARNAIKCAAISAGFFVLKLITEPVAASIASVQDAGNGYYLVYDLGGGTFDISLLKFEDGVFQILAIDGLPDFGGIDVDEIISTHLNIPLQEAKIYKENGKFDDALRQKINKELAKTYAIVFNVLNANNFKTQDIKQLILAGGSARLPMIMQHLSQYFNVQMASQPEHVISAGAALTGFQLTNNSDDKQILIDAIPFNLGIETLGNKIEILIPKNSPLPSSRTEYFYPQSEKIQINVLQGVGDKASEYTNLASIELTNVKDKFPITFMLDCDAILSIKIGTQVMVVSMRNYTANADETIINLHNKALSLGPKTNEQKRYMEYLEQAKNIPLSENARAWLQEKFKELFENS